MWFKKAFFSFFTNSPHSKLYFTLVIFGLIPFLVISEYNNWGGDFSLYLNQSIGFLEGDLTSIYQKQHLLSNYQRLGPYLYPMGTSVLISPVLFFFGVNFYYLKVYGLIYWIGSLFFLYKYLKFLFPDNENIYKVLLFISLSYPFITILNTVQADIYFFFFFNLIVYSFLLIKKRVSFVKCLFFGIILFILYSIKTEGIIVVALYSFYSLIQTIKQRKLVYTVPLVVFGVFYFFYNILFPFDFSSNQLDFVYNNLSIHSVLNNLSYYSYIFAQYFSGGLFYLIDDFSTLNILTFLIVLLFFVILTINHKKVLLTIKKDGFIYFVLVVFISFFIMLPMTNGPRYLFPIFPILFFLIFNVISRKSVNFLIFIQAISLFSYVFIENTKRFDFDEIHIQANVENIIDKLPMKLGNKFTANINYDYSNSLEMKRVYSFIDETIPNDTVIFTKPRVLNLFSNVVAVPETEDAINDFNYIIINRSISKTDLELLKKWNEIYRSDNVVVFKK